MPADISVEGIILDNSMDHGLEKNRREDSMATPSSSTPPPRGIRTLAQRQSDGDACVRHTCDFVIINDTPTCSPNAPL
ncbi:hypothetical protein Y032_0379g313 [Ancylostoma ceylanicum]|uniref:Uncharacterized protein n=1 Tax=Ancylostoma ceylanicum TaxID=53326 RepID=A0A016RTB7_9BILA|nr:hypothetical protein Y032_0379g313 [Ancylostoma ceylanicum]